MSKQKQSSSSIIRELIRTRVCDSVITLKVLNVRVVPTSYVSDSLTAFLLLVTDGTKTIQAVVRHEIHSQMVTDWIVSGTTIRISIYNIASGKHVDHEGNVLFIKIHEFQPVRPSKETAQPFIYRDLIDISTSAGVVYGRSHATTSSDDVSESGSSSSVSIDGGFQGEDYPCPGQHRPLEDA